MRNMSQPAVSDTSFAGGRGQEAFGSMTFTVILHTSPHLASPILRLKGHGLFRGDIVTPYRTLEWKGDCLLVLDQRTLPHRVTYQTLRTPQEVWRAIREMAIRGAPAIGAAAAFGLALAARRSAATDRISLLNDLRQAARELQTARPTAVNLAWALDRVLARATDPHLGDPEAVREAVTAEALAIAEQDAATNRQLALHGLALVPDRANILHHCNTGSLATVDYGTALGIIRAAHENGKRIHVYVDETRPRLQGARLTAWELQQLGIPHTVIVAEEGSSVTLIEEHVSQDDDRPGQSSAVVELLVRDRATVRYIGVQDWGKNVNSFSTIRAVLGADSRLEFGLIGSGSRSAKANVEAVLSAPGASANIVGLFLAGGEQHMAYSTLQDHLAPSTTSDLLFKSVLKDSSHLVWNGLTRIHKGAAESDANQSNQNLLLGENAGVAPIPVLEIEAHDVTRCSHGATVSSVDEEQLYYMMSRGLTRQDATQAIVDGFLRLGLERLTPVSANDGIGRTLERRLLAKVA